jgi:hypothetical protein
MDTGSEDRAHEQLQLLQLPDLRPGDRPRPPPGHVAQQPGDEPLEIEEAKILPFSGERTSK